MYIQISMIIILMEDTYPKFMQSYINNITQKKRCAQWSGLFQVRSAKF